MLVRFPSLPLRRAARLLDDEPRLALDLARLRLRLGASLGVGRLARLQLLLVPPLPLRLAPRMLLGLPRCALVRAPCGVRSSSLLAQRLLLEQQDLLLLGRRALLNLLRLPPCLRRPSQLRFLGIPHSCERRTSLLLLMLPALPVGVFPGVQHLRTPLPLFLLPRGEVGLTALLLA